MSLRHPVSPQRLYVAHLIVWVSSPQRLYVAVCSHSTGWRRLLGCLKLQVIFRKRATNYRALLRKMTCEDKASCASMPLCIELTFEKFLFEKFLSRNSTLLFNSKSSAKNFGGKNLTICYKKCSCLTMCCKQSTKNRTVCYKKSRMCYPKRNIALTFEI